MAGYSPQAIAMALFDCGRFHKTTEGIHIKADELSDNVERNLHPLNRVKWSCSVPDIEAWLGL